MRRFNAPASLEPCRGHTSSVHSWFVPRSVKGFGTLATQQRDVFPISVCDLQNAKRHSDRYRVQLAAALVCYFVFCSQEKVFSGAVIPMTVHP